MKRVTYTNRYGDNLVFEETNENEVQMSGFEHYRIGETFIDPSGGPYIQIGSDVGKYFNDKKIRRVKKINISEEGTVLFTV